MFGLFNNTGKKLVETIKKDNDLIDKQTNQLLAKQVLTSAIYCINQKFNDDNSGINQLNRILKLDLDYLEDKTFIINDNLYQLVNVNGFIQIQLVNL